MEVYVLKKLYIGNLPFTATEDSVREFFSQVGEITSLNLISDLHTGRPRGFGFIEMEEADKAVNELNGKDFGGRAIKVDIARERPDRGHGGRGGGRGEWGGGGRGGYSGERRERRW